MARRALDHRGRRRHDRAAGLYHGGISYLDRSAGAIHSSGHLALLHRQTRVNLLVDNIFIGSELKGRLKSILTGLIGFQKHPFASQSDTTFPNRDIGPFGLFTKFNLRLIHLAQALSHLFLGARVFHAAAGFFVGTAGGQSEAAGRLMRRRTLDDDRARQNG